MISPSKSVKGEVQTMSCLRTKMDGKSFSLCERSGVNVFVHGWLTVTFLTEEVKFTSIY